MTDIELDTAIERDAEQQWEEQNSSDESEKVFNAYAPMCRAVDGLREALSRMAEAVDQLEGTSSYDKLMSLMNDLEDLECDAVRARDRFEKGGEM